MDGLKLESLEVMTENAGAALRIVAVAGERQIPFVVHTAHLTQWLNERGESETVLLLVGNKDLQ